MISEEALRIPAFQRKKEGGCCAVKAKKAAAAKKTASAAGPKLSPLGMVTHFYDRISVAVLKLKRALSIGDQIQLIGKSGPFFQTVSSIQIEHETKSRAKKGDDIGLKVDQPVTPHKAAFLVK